MAYNRKTAGRRLAEAIRAAGMTQVGFAEKVGVTEATISRLCTGATDLMKSRNLKSIAGHLGVTPGYLLFGGRPVQAATESIKRGDPMSARVAQLRQEMGWNVAELAEEAGLFPAAIRDIEDGVRNEPLDAFRIARAMGVPRAYVAGRGDSDSRGERGARTYEEGLLDGIDAAISRLAALRERYAADVAADRLGAVREAEGQDDRRPKRAGGGPDDPSP